MSLVELQERLRMNKIREQELEEQTREKLRQQKVEKVVELRRKMENVSEIRAYAQQANAERRVRSAMTAEEQAKRLAQEADARNETLVSRLRGLRSARQREQEKLDAECAAVAKARLLLGAGKQQMEQQFNQDAQDGLEREARARQEGAKRAAARHEQGKTAARDQAMAYQKVEARKQRALEDKRAEQVDAAAKYMGDKAFAQKREKQAKFRATREQQQAALAARDERNRYAAAANQKSIEKSRHFVAAQQQK
jgi:hypothetical protein